MGGPLPGHNRTFQDGGPGTTDKAGQTARKTNKMTRKQNRSSFIRSR